MHHDTNIWLIFLAIAAATTLPRASFIVLGSRVTLPSVLLRALRYAPAAALAAIIAPDIFLISGTIDPLNPKLGAAIVAIAIAVRFKNPWLPFLSGMGALWGLRWLAGT